MKNRLVFATNNPHKLEEARRILSDSVDVVSLSDIGCHDDIPETADTLEGNALIKARWVNSRYGVDCFADDTGLMVDALDGAPGVLSARYAGEHCSPADNVAKLLNALDGREDRNAHFSTVIALIKDGEEHCFEGRVDGVIDTECTGEGGFGYDPVFVPEEAGVSFATMSADAKNAISHRGRAMSKLRDFLALFAIALMSILLPANALAEEWRLHSSYDGNMDRIIDTKKYTYFLGLRQPFERGNSVTGQKFGDVYRYDKQNDEFTWLNSQNLLSGDIVCAIAYNFDKNYLAIAYRDGNIDLLYDNDDVVNIPGLKIADSSLTKTINNFTFDPASNSVICATEFGYVVLNDKTGEVDYSRVYNVPVVAAAKLGDVMLLCTETEIVYGDPKEFNYSNLTKFDDFKKVDKLFKLDNNTIYALYGNPDFLRCGRFTMNGGKLRLEAISREAETNMEMAPGAIHLVGETVVRRIAADKSETTIPVHQADRKNLAGSSDGRTFWFSDGRNGIYMKSVDSAGTWTLKKDKFRPNAANAFMSTAMQHSSKYGMLVRNHGMDQNFTTQKYNVYVVSDLISGYKSGSWTPLSTTYRDPRKSFLVDNPSGLAIDPKNPDHVYCGSLRSGFFRLDMANPANSIHFGKTTDNMFQGHATAGYVAVVPDHNDCVWKEMCAFAPPGFDAAGNLWTAYNVPNGTSAEAVNAELWVWTPEDRAASTSYSNVRPFRKITVKDMPISGFQTIMPLKSSVNKNIVLYCGNTTQSPLLVLDHKGTLDNTSDDRQARMKSIFDQDGQSVSFVRAYCYYEEPQSGMVWVGHIGGVFTFNPTQAFTNPTSVRRVKVARNDGTNLADYLLDGVTVNMIIADNDGRKWFATTGAGLVCTNASGTEIIKTYNMENSDLPGDNVYAVALNPDNNSLMISTDNGLCELFLSGAAADSSSEQARVYPNPVRPDYFGYVTIDNLPSDGIVKIVDAGGNLVAECGMASNGSVQWDITNLSHKRVPGGVYYVVASKGPSGESFSKVSKLLVVD